MIRFWTGPYMDWSFYGPESGLILVWVTVTNLKSRKYTVITAGQIYITVNRFHIGDKKWYFSPPIVRVRVP